MKIHWSEKDEKYWVRGLDGEVLWFEAALDAFDAARQIEIDSAVKAEVEAITKWLKAHGMRQIANSIERREYK